MHRLATQPKYRPLSPYQELAIGVLQNAVKELYYRYPAGKSPQHDQNVRDQARAFLTTNNKALSAWCAVAGITPGYVHLIARRAIEHPEQINFWYELAGGNKRGKVTS
jgi:hypothetical protein